MCFKSLKTLVLAVEENNVFNDAKWSDWSDAGHIAETYEETDISDEEAQILNRAIESNGLTIEADMSAAHKVEHGVEFNTWR